MKDSRTVLFVPAVANCLHHHAPAAVAVHRGLVRARRGTVVTAMSGGSTPTSWEDYMKARQSGQFQGGTMDEAQKDLKVFIEGGGDMEFDGGDSGGGVVGDGNVDLEDQHNSASMLRSGYDYSAAVGRGGPNVGRGKVQSAIEARTASAGANYFGRSTGYADELIAEITEEEKMKHKMDSVRAQQLENWHNQRQIHEMNSARGRGVMYGAPEPYQPPGSWASQAAANMQAQGGVVDEWGPLVIDPSEEPTEVFDVKSRLDSTHVTEITVRNPFCRFLQYRAVFTADSSPFFRVTPENGTMNRNDGKPETLTVRFTPGSLGQVSATLVVETDDFKKVYKFIGATD
mmetsp:Transcript_4457/g.8143  ORF Transcript_4457/g.8143 Transcript_4457/m.8143 type:complete len:344 (+) Transcript_4457:292-1323(+)|eukprot:CAMPEP_0184692144 /NCGR_PEP_ID=MMETSP0313-20130426/744_1 /TAXON_ID=2792 /ORGANISM="Porphyridium aerugineum, Strain SAG 1380-2" /LENGTH=343 /DNA_ID=CAMNT_0027149953 /DNA_START=251 /DNA_END=1282 /DNA_ORIENTATION=-